MTTPKFSDYFECFKNENAVIVGKGPTTYDYNLLKDFTNPIFFINEAALLSEVLKLNNQDRNFMFAHDRNTWKAVKQSQFYTCVLPRWNQSDSRISKKYCKSYIDQHGIPIRNYSLMYNKELNIFPRDSYLFDSEKTYRNEKKTTHPFPSKREVRNEIEEKEWLPAHVGTIRTAIMFAFYTGINHIKMIGCDGLTIHDWDKKDMWAYDERLRCMISSRPWGNHLKLKIMAEHMMRNLDITFEYLGSPL